MTKSALNSSDLALLREQYHSISDVRLHIVKPVTVATLTVSTTPSDNPASSLTVSGSMSSVLVGQRFCIRDTSDNIVSWGTIRKAPSGSTLYISPVSIGDSGYVQPIMRSITSTNIVTVYDDFPLWGDYSRIAGISSAKSFRKQWDVAYSNQNEDIPPIANAGTSQSARISVGASASFTLPKAGSNTSFAFGSETITTYAWTLPTGVSLSGGYALSDAVIEVTATVGQHKIKLVVTDTNAVTHTAYTWLFVSDGVTYKDLFEEYYASIDNDSGDINGWTLGFTLTGTSLEDAIFPGAYVHFQADSLYNGSSLANLSDVDTFVGYVSDFQYTHNGEYGQASITAVSPYLYLRNVYMPPQLMQEVSNPSNWTEVTSDLSNPRGALCYNRWQCYNLFAMHDVDASYTSPRKHDIAFNGSTIASGLDVAAQVISGNVGSASDGTTVLRKNPNIQNNTFRNALAIGMTFTESDIVGQLNYPVTVQPPYADVRAGGFWWNGSKDKAWYGVKRWGQGGGETKLPDFAVHSDEGLSEVLERVGHLYAQQNHPEEISLTFNRNINIIDPVYMIWYRLNVPSDYDARGRGWDNTRFLANRVSRNWDIENYTRTIQATLKEETFGQVADEWVIGSSNTITSGSWVMNLDIPYSPQDDLFGVLPSVALLYNTDGKLAITQNLTADSPDYTELDSYMDGTVCDVCFDYNSGFFTSGYILTQPLSVYVVTASGTSLNIYRITDIKSPSIEIETILKTYTMNDSSTTTSARIACSKTTPGFVIVAWHDQTGVLVGRSTDSGATWGSAVQVGSAITDTANDNAEIGLYVSGTNQLVTAPDSGSQYGVYLATTTGGSFSELANSEESDTPSPMVTGDGDTTLYVTVGETVGGADPTLYEFNWDDSTDTNYTLGTSYASPLNVSYLSESGNGNGGGNCVNYIQAGAVNPTPVKQLIAISIDVSPLDISDLARIEADFYTNKSSGHLSYDTELLGFSGYSGTFGDVPTLDTWTTYYADTFTSAGATSFTIRITVVGTSPHTLSDIDVRIDNIKVWATYTGGSSPIDPKLYKVTTYTTTDGWTDITESDYVPLLPYGLGIDLADSDNLELAGDDGTDPHYLDSTDTGTTFNDNGATDYRIIKRVGDTIIYAGDSAFDVSFDNGVSGVDKLGNLDVVWGSVGTIKNVLTVGLE